MSSIKEHEFQDLDIARFRADYFRDGCVVVRKAVEPELVRAMHERLLGFFKAVLAIEKPGTAGAADIDAAFAEVSGALGADRSKYLLTIGKDFPAFLRLISSPNIVGMLRRLFDTEEIQTVFDSNVFRIDRPLSDHTNLDWHQDYPYNMLAMDAATAWIPIVKVSEQMGRLQVVVPRSELLDVEYDALAKAQFHNSRYFRIKSLSAMEAEFESRAATAPDMNPGDVLLLHALSVHKSGANRSNRCRWVATARFGRFMDPKLYARAWFTMRSKYPDVFRNYHPENFSIKAP